MNLLSCLIFALICLPKYVLLNVNESNNEERCFINGNSQKRSDQLKNLDCVYSVTQHTPHSQNSFFFSNLLSTLQKNSTFHSFLHYNSFLSSTFYSANSSLLFTSISFIQMQRNCTLFINNNSVLEIKSCFVYQLQSAVVSQFYSIGGQFLLNNMSFHSSDTFQCTSPLINSSYTHLQSSFHSKLSIESSQFTSLNCPSSSFLYLPSLRFLHISSCKFCNFSSTAPTLHESFHYISCQSILSGNEFSSVENIFGGSIFCGFHEFSEFISFNCSYFKLANFRGREENEIFTKQIVITPSSDISFSFDTFSSCCTNNSKGTDSTDPTCSGGAIYARGLKRFDLKIDSCSFKLCQSGAHGGAVYSSGTRRMMISNSNFTDCYANNGEGGAVYSGHNEIHECVNSSNIKNCTSKHKGGGIVMDVIRYELIVKTERMVCGHNQFVNCSSLSGCGGSAVITGFGLCSYVVGCSFFYSRAETFGGALFLQIPSDQTFDYTVSKCFFHKNIACNGKGYDCYFVDLSKLFKDKSCISGSFSTTDSPNRVWWDGGDESCECGGWINHGVTVLYVDEKQGIDDIGCGFPTNFGKPCKTLQFSIEAPSHWNTNQIDVSSGTYEETSCIFIESLYLNIVGSDNEKPIIIPKFDKVQEAIFYITDSRFILSKIDIIHTRSDTPIFKFFGESPNIILTVVNCSIKPETKAIVMNVPLFDLSVHRSRVSLCNITVSNFHCDGVPVILVKPTIDIGVSKLRSKSNEHFPTDHKSILHRMNLAEQYSKFSADGPFESDQNIGLALVNSNFTSIITTGGCPCVLVTELSVVEETHILLCQFKSCYATDSKGGACRIEMQKSQKMKISNSTFNFCCTLSDEQSSHEAKPQLNANSTAISQLKTNENVNKGGGLFCMLMEKANDFIFNNVSFTGNGAKVGRDLYFLCMNIVETVTFENFLNIFFPTFFSYNSMMGFDSRSLTDISLFDILKLQSNDIYVSDEGIAADWFLCGNDDMPCKTLSVGIEHINFGNNSHCIIKNNALLGDPFIISSTTISSATEQFANVRIRNDKDVIDDLIYILNNGTNTFVRILFDVTSTISNAATIFCSKRLHDDVQNQSLKLDDCDVLVSAVYFSDINYFLFKIEEGDLVLLNTSIEVNSPFGYALLTRPLFLFYDQCSLIEFNEVTISSFHFKNDPALKLLEEPKEETATILSGLHSSTQVPPNDGNVELNVRFHDSNISDIETSGNCPAFVDFKVFRKKSFMIVRNVDLSRCVSAQSNEGGAMRFDFPNEGRHNLYFFDHSNVYHCECSKENGKGGGIFIRLRSKQSMTVMFVPRFRGNDAFVGRDLYLSQANLLKTNTEFHFANDSGLFNDEQNSMIFEDIETKTLGDLLELLAYKSRILYVSGLILPDQNARNWVNCGSEKYPCFSIDYCVKHRSEETELQIVLMGPSLFEQPADLSSTILLSKDEKKEISFEGYPINESYTYIVSTALLTFTNITFLLPTVNVSRLVSLISFFDGQVIIMNSNFCHSDKAPKCSVDYSLVTVLSGIVTVENVSIDIGQGIMGSPLFHLSVSISRFECIFVSVQNVKLQQAPAIKFSKFNNLNSVICSSSSSFKHKSNSVLNISCQNCIFSNIKTNRSYSSVFYYEDSLFVDVTFSNTTFNYCVSDGFSTGGAIHFSFNPLSSIFVGNCTASGCSAVPGVGHRTFSYGSNFHAQSNNSGNVLASYRSANYETLGGWMYLSLCSNKTHQKSSDLSSSSAYVSSAVSSDLRIEFIGDIFTNNKATRGRDLFLVVDSIKDSVNPSQFTLDFDSENFKKSNALIGSDDKNFYVDLLDYVYMYRAENLYFSNQGSDSTQCGSIQKPCKSFHLLALHRLPDRNAIVHFQGNVFIDRCLNVTDTNIVPGFNELQSNLSLSRSFYSSKDSVLSIAGSFTITSMWITSQGSSFSEYCTFFKGFECEMIFYKIGFDIIDIMKNPLICVQKGSLTIFNSNISCMSWRTCSAIVIDESSIDINLLSKSIDVKEGLFFDIRSSNSATEGEQSMFTWKITNSSFVNCSFDPPREQKRCIGAIGLMKVNEKSNAKDDIIQMFLHNNTLKDIHSSSSLRGGAIFFGLAEPLWSISVDSSTFDNCKVEKGNGGGCYVDINHSSNPHFSFQDVIFTNNKAKYGHSMFFRFALLETQVVKMKMHLYTNLKNFYRENSIVGIDPSKSSPILLLPYFDRVEFQRRVVSEQGNNTKCAKNDEPCRTFKAAIDTLLPSDDSVVLIDGDISVTEVCTIIKGTIKSQNNTTESGKLIFQQVKELGKSKAVIILRGNVLFSSLTFAAQLIDKEIKLEKIFECEAGMCIFNNCTVPTISLLNASFIVAGGERFLLQNCIFEHVQSLSHFFRLANGTLELENCDFSSFAIQNSVIQIDGPFFLKISKSKFNLFNCINGIINNNCYSLSNKKSMIQLYATNVTNSKNVVDSTAFFESCSPLWAMIIYDCYFSNIQAFTSSFGGSIRSMFGPKSYFYANDSSFIESSAHPVSGRGGWLYVNFSHDCPSYDIVFKIDGGIIAQNNAAYGLDIFMCYEKGTNNISSCSFTLNFKNSFLNHSNSICGCDWRDTTIIENLYDYFVFYSDRIAYVSSSGDDSRGCGSSEMCCKTIATALCHVLPEKEDCQVTIIDSALLNVGCGICDITITASKDTVGCDIFVDFDNNLSSSCAIVCEGSSRLANINFCIINIPIISSFKLIKARNDSLIIFNVGVEVPQNKFVNDILLGMTLVYVGGGSVQISQMHLANLNFFSNPIQISNFEQFVIAESTFVDISIKSSSFITFLNESSFDQKSLLINSTNFTRVNAIDNQPSVLSSTVGLIFNICDSFFISCNANDRKGSAMEFHNSVSISIAGCTFIGSLMLNSASSSLSFLPYPQELSAGQYFEEEEYASCGWSHSLVYIFNAKCSCTNTRFLFSERGALAVSESNLNITNCTFAGNSALDNDFPHIRHNILCESHSEIQLSSLSSGDGTHNKVDNYDVPFSTSLWLLQNNCEVHSALSEDIPSLYFVPLITQASYSTNPADSSSYKLMVNGSSFFPCGIRVALRCGNDSPENWVNISSFALDNENTITASISPAQFKCKLQHLKKSSEKNTPTLSVALIYPTSLLMDTVQKLPSTLSSSTSKYDSDFSQIDFLVTPFVPLSTSLTKSFPWYFVVIPVGSITFIVIIIATIVAIVRWKRRSDEETDQIVTLGSEALFDVKEVTHKELRKMNRKKLKKLPNLITSESSTVTSSSYSSSEESYSTIDSADSEHLQSSDEGNFSEEVDENELGFKEKKAQDISSRTLEQKSSGNFLTHFFKTNFRFMRKKDQYSLLGLDEHNSCSPYGSFETTIN